MRLASLVPALLTTALLAVLPACGGDDDDGGGAACEAPGAASVDGEVGGVALDAVSSAVSGPVTFFGGYLTVVVISEGDTTCTSGAVDGDRLLLYFCTPPQPGALDVVAFADFPEQACPDAPVVTALVESGTGGDAGDATSGTVTIDAIDGCVTGSFDLELEDADTGAPATMSGTFGALACDAPLF